MSDTPWEMNVQRTPEPPPPGPPLLQGEHILWTGRPGQGLRFMAQDLFAVPFALIWCAVVGTFTYHSFVSGAPLLFHVVGFTFLAFGGFLLFGRFALDAWMRAGMRYTVTNRRILISRPRPFQALLSVDLAQIPSVEMVQTGGMTGTLQFGPQIVRQAAQGGMTITIPSFSTTPQFFQISDVQTVLRIVQEAQHRLRQGRA